jgi:methylenetetrahydrofolate reductase (NADPH)
MSVLPFSRKGTATPPAKDLMARFSIEVLPRTAARIEDFRTILPSGTRVYIAHIDGTSMDDMVQTAARLTREGFTPMPHVPARLVADRATLQTWLTRYRDEADVTEALVLAGSLRSPRGAFHSSMQLLETGLFDALGFTRLHVAGHPEGNRDIDADGSSRQVDEAALWKARFAERTDAAMALVTQFAFEAEPVLSWARRIEAAGVDLPVHVGLAGPTKLNTLIRFAIACGVGPSLKVLQKHALDLTKLAVPFKPTDVLTDLATGVAEGKGGRIESVHLFPLGGIEPAAAYATAARWPAPAAARG